MNSFYYDGEGNKPDNMGVHTGMYVWESPHCVLLHDQHTAVARVGKKMY
mgnify:CR=1 FL=1